MKARRKPYTNIRPGDEFGKCPRCGGKFVPEWNDSLAVFSRCCVSCSIRNLADNLQMPELYEAANIPRDSHSKL